MFINKETTYSLIFIYLLTYLLTYLLSLSATSSLAKYSGAVDGEIETVDRSDFSKIQTE